jgi:hypothetical protein
MNCLGIWVKPKLAKQNSTEKFVLKTPISRSLITSKEAPCNINHYWFWQSKQVRPQPLKQGSDGKGGA